MRIESVTPDLVSILDLEGREPPQVAVLRGELDLAKSTLHEGWKYNDAEGLKIRERFGQNFGEFVAPFIEGIGLMISDGYQPVSPNIVEGRALVEVRCEPLALEDHKEFEPVLNFDIRENKRIDVVSEVGVEHCEYRVLFSALRLQYPVNADGIEDPKIGFGYRLKVGSVAMVRRVLRDVEKVFAQLGKEKMHELYGLRAFIESGSCSSVIGFPKNEEEKIKRAVEDDFKLRLLEYLGKGKLF